MYTRQHFYFVNWDDEKSQTVDLDMFESLNFEYLDREKDGAVKGLRSGSSRFWGTVISLSVVVMYLV